MSSAARQDGGAAEDGVGSGTRDGTGHAAVPAQRIRSFIDLWVGEQLRNRRKALGRSLQEVAAACGISVSLLSALERGLRSASVQTLHAAARVLEVPIETFLANLNADAAEGDGAPGAVVRAGRHRRVDSTGIRKEVLTPPLVADGNLQLYRARIEPGGSTGNTFFTTFEGHQVGFVIEGSLELQVGDRLHRLRQGDSFCYENQTPRRWCNPGPGETVVLWAVALPPRAAPGRAVRRGTAP